MSVFLFTDIEGSTKKWEKHSDEMNRILPRHDKIIKENIEKSGGVIIKHTGDGVFAVFENGDPLLCVLQIQKQFAEEDWGEIGELRIRMGLHAGRAEKHGNDYFGPVVNRAARIMGAAWGGQIILTASVSNAAKLPEHATFKDLGVHLLKDLGEPQQIYQLMHPDLTLQEFPSLRSLSAHPHNLPIQTTPFLGREDESVEIARLLNDPSCRLLTLIGPGGIGKTRLALQTAAERIEDFAHGVHLISLAPLRSPDFLISTIAEALKFSFYSREDQKVQLLNYLRGKEILLILDNFEHLIEGVAIIGEILSSSPKVKILATSRELLNLKGEWIFHVRGMKVPHVEEMDVDGYSAVQLFRYNVHRVDANLTITDEDKRFVIRICQLVGGMPLGIELASAWLRMLSCKEIAQEIEKNLDFLASSMRDVPERHRSMRAVFEYSWNLISLQEKTVLRRLSIFRGEFQRAAAERVASASLPLLAALVDKSLLRKTISGNYEMLNIVRLYAAQKLAEENKERDSVQNLHCKYYSDFLEEMEKNFIGAEQGRFLERVSEQIENIRVAWQWAVSHNKKVEIAKLATSIYHFHERKGWFKEGEEIFREAVDALTEDKKDENYAIILAGYGWFSFRIGHSEKARKLLEQSLGIFRKSGTQEKIAETLNNLGVVVSLLGEYNESKKLLDESLKIYRTINDRFGIATASHSLSSVIVAMGDYNRARQLSEESLSLYRAIGDQYGIAASLNTLGSTAHTVGDGDRAKQLYLESLAICKELGDKMGIGKALNNVANVYSTQGDYERAKQYYRESLEIFRELGNLRGVASALINLGIIARYFGENRESERLHLEGLDICKSISYQLGIAVSFNNLAAVARVEGDFKKAKQLQEESLAIGRNIGDKWMIGTTLENLADTSFRLEEYEDSKKYCFEALRTALETKIMPLAVAVLIGFAKLWIKEGRKEEALELLFFSTHHHSIAPDLIRDAEPFISALKKELSRQRVDAALEKAKSRKFEEIAAEILAEK